MAESFLIRHKAMRLKQVIRPLFQSFSRHWVDLRKTSCFSESFFLQVLAKWPGLGSKKSQERLASLAG